ncbi:MAG: 1-acyl-sn-glycerol-3-phosphate acyltransferase [Kofleriaceae bacterium]|jgi:1-acyl-sn-glycerol-3-phosphate acyltransferase|nr:1-acyl-sn-glycerol-3-phosphate acyltransferase [Kofleriaceae bacterium]MBP6836470.1 1-acyl-sn-glycerol-3-phosphate acyltransferase [Kofleriaceae bacterium]MBP9207481.1 1-acyl-sn-glycerol-3-phosphate acyltransferase [Kofleriaceae bacterium]
MADDTLELTGWEKLAHRATASLNESRWGRAWQTATLRTFSYAWVRQAISPRMLTSGLDELIAQRPERGVLLVSNHRSFFDLYSMMLAMYMGPTPWAGRINFPVRSNFFYDHPLGLAVNYLCCGGAMYPPIYRQAERRAQNDESLDRIVEMLRQPGQVIGLHPEGTRSKDPDPYKFLPAQPGAGKMVLAAQPMVVPVFVNGINNDFLGEVRYSWRDIARRERPIIGVFGPPIDYSKFLAEKPRPTVYKRCADFLMSKVAELIPTEQALRAQCVAGQISDDDPRWLSNRRTVSPLYARRG